MHHPPHLFSVVVPDDELVAQLMSLGYGENGCRRAAVAVNNASAGAFLDRKIVCSMPLASSPGT